mmetsp:Transcript_31439/g.57041  ORF Transcript_31439/g.57041 Transcript_31439/m.57041 type:complete len:282 (+) Transcript_31439:36-881(+)
MTLQMNVATADECGTERVQSGVLPELVDLEGQIASSKLQGRTASSNVTSQRSWSALSRRSWSARVADTEDLPAEERYAMAGSMGRACPERYIALLVTLAVEVPVTFLVGTGSSSLVDHLGLDRYTMLMAFLPLTSAISGNVGLQASTLTTRAISSKHCTKETFCQWFRTEVFAALILAVGCGFAVFLLAFVWSLADKTKDTDLGFAITVGLSQVFSIAVAGITGTLAPVFFSIVCGLDAGKWAGPLETAIQDIAGTFAVVYVAQWILLFFVKVGISPATPA